jgi:hypothetical protein
LQALAPRLRAPRRKIAAQAEISFHHLAVRPANLKGDFHMATHRPGGGIDSRVVKNVRAPKTEPIPHKVTPGAADALGQAMAYKPPPLYSGKGYATPQGPSSNMGQGPGANRTLYGQGGTQGIHGPINRGEGPSNPPRDILSEFGPDVPGRR